MGLVNGPSPRRRNPGMWVARSGTVSAIANGLLLAGYAPLAMSYVDRALKTANEHPDTGFPFVDLQHQGCDAAGAPTGRRSRAGRTDGDGGGEGRGSTHQAGRVVGAAAPRSRRNGANRIWRSVISRKRSAPPGLETSNGCSQMSRPNWPTPIESGATWTRPSARPRGRR